MGTYTHSTHSGEAEGQSKARQKPQVIGTDAFHALEDPRGAATELSTSISRV